MKKLGNISGMVYTSYPAQWDDVYVCDKCGIKKTVREHASHPDDYSYVKKYKDV